MTVQQTHVLQVEWVEERQLLRFYCPLCERCLESDPEGLRLIHRGDQTVRHVGGSLALDTEIQGQGPGQGLQPGRVH